MSGLYTTFFGSTPLTYKMPWDQRTLLKGTILDPVAIDTETVLIDKSKSHDVPECVLISVATQLNRFILRPDQLADFLSAHYHCHFVAHNAAFDYWVIHELLKSRVRHSISARTALKEWITIAASGRLHDTMILDQLIRLGSEGVRNLPPRNLGVLSKEYLKTSAVNKEDPYRLRYHEIKNRNFTSVDKGFFDYAIRDAYATSRIWRKLYEKSLYMMKRVQASGAKDLKIKDVLEQYGPLTESLQVRGAIALFQAGRNGIHVDTLYAKDYVTKLKKELDLHLEVLLKNQPDILVYEDECGAKGIYRKQLGNQPVIPGLIERKVSRTDLGGCPRFKKAKLKSMLESFCKQHDLPVLISCGKEKGTSLSAKQWVSYRGKSPVVDAWIELSHLTKTLGYADPLTKTSEINPNYKPLLVTGRSACTNPNLQQYPRSKDFRQIFKARHEHKLITVDYSFIELRTLAHICEARYGKSVLANVIRDGRDPHTFTAAMFTNEEYQSLLQKVEQGDKAAKAARQAAKAVNFGVPGGLGARKLATYAAETYGVSMSEEQARELRERLIKEVYPEIDKYLQENNLINLTLNTGIKPDSLIKIYKLKSASQLGKALSVTRKMLAGKLSEKEQKYAPRIWYALARIAHYIRANISKEVHKSILSKQSTPEVESALFGGTAYTPTGRLRSGCNYSQYRNSPFQGLAADGAKLALFNLTAAGYRVVGFLHDEIIVEIEEIYAEKAFAEVQQIMNVSMSKVLGSVPSSVSGHVGTTWEK